MPAVTKSQLNMKIKNSFKQWQIEKNIVDATSSIERFFTTRVRTVGLLQLILPIGWRISKIDESKLKWVERDIQCTDGELYNVFTSLRNNKVHIYNYFQSDFNKDYITVRLNINIDTNDRLILL